MPSDLIYREDAKDYARYAMANGLNVLEYLDEVPASDFRPVVLCKECKYRNTDKYGSWCLNDYENNLKDDDFCSRGKRK